MGNTPNSQNEPSNPQNSQNYAPYRRLKLSGLNGKGKFALISVSDYPKVSNLRWSMHYGGYIQGYYPTNDGGPKKKVLLSRVILDILDEPDLKVLHINSDKLDNRRENLKIVSHRESMESRPAFRASKHSNFRGVTFNESRQQWEIRQMIDGEVYRLGFYDTEAEAAKKVAAFRVSRLRYPHIDDIVLSEGVEPPIPITERVKSPKLPSSGYQEITKQGNKWQVEIDGVFCGRYSSLSEAEEVVKGGLTKYYELNDLKFDDLRAKKEQESDQSTENRGKKALEDKKIRRAIVEAHKELQKAQKAVERAQKEYQKAEKRAKREKEQLEARELAKLVKNEIKMIKNMKHKVKRAQKRIDRARKQYEANKIRRANGMEPLPLLKN